MSAGLPSSRQSTPARGQREYTPVLGETPSRVLDRLARMRSGTPADPNTPKHPRAKGRIGTPTPSRGASLTPGPQTLPQKPAKSRRPVCKESDCDAYGTPDHVVKEDNGNVVCGLCGILISESHIAADPTFQEGSNGAAQLMGQHIGAGQTHGHQDQGVNQILGVSDSGSMTRSTALADIKKIGYAMGIRDDSLHQRGHRIWQVVYNMGRTKGRERAHVNAVCLYMACKRDSAETNRHLLIDFADQCNVSVFYLGRIYQDFVKLPGFHDKIGGGRLHAVNAENLIHRYVSELDIPGDNQWTVASEACQIFRRMDRDWMTTGRRPSGLCGAAVFLAARMNNFRRTVREIVYTAKVCEVTINQRLEEFSNTAASKMTVKDFRDYAHDRKPMDHETQDEGDADPLAACAPPAYYKQFLPKKTRKRKHTREASVASDATETNSMAIDPDLDAEPSSSQTEEAPESEDQPAKRRKTGKATTTKQSAAARKKAKKDKEAMPPPPPPIDPALLALANQEYANMTTSDSQLASRSPSQEPEEPLDTTQETEGNTETYGQAARESSPKQKQKVVTIAEPTPAENADYIDLEKDIEALAADPAHITLAEQAHEDIEKNPPPAVPDKQAHEQEGMTLRKKRSVEPILDDEDDADMPDVANHPDLQLPMVQDSEGNWVEKVYWPTTASKVAKVPDTEIIPEEEFAHDPEVDDCFLNDQEREVKTAAWLSRHGAYLRHQHLKKISRLLDEKNGVIKIRSKRTKPQLGDVSHYEKYADGTVAKDMAEVYQKLWQNRAPKSINSKLNWQVVRDIFRNQGDDAAEPESPSDRPDGSPSPGSEAGTPRSRNTPIFSRGDLMLKKAPRAPMPSTRAGRDAVKAQNQAKKAARKAEKEKAQEARDEQLRAGQAERAKQLEQLTREAGVAEEMGEETVVEETVEQDFDPENVDMDNLTDAQREQLDRLNKVHRGEAVDDELIENDDFGGLDDREDSEGEYYSEGEEL